MRILAAALVAASISAGLSAQEPPSTAEPSEAALKQLLVDREKQSWEAWKNRDAKFFRDFLSDDHVEVGFFGIEDKAAVLAGVASPACVVRSYRVDHFELTVFGPTTALLTYHADQDTTCGQTVVPSPVWVSSLFVKRGDQWWNAVYQQTQTKREPSKP